MNGLKISAIEPSSTALEIGLSPGDEIISINGKEVPDYLAYRYLIYSEDVNMLVRKKTGELVEIELEKDEEDDLGIVPPPMRVRCCNNKCVFCFVAQMPRGLRRSLYVRDEDYRMSFLHGSYITLTTLKDEDYKRIIEERLSPLYVSVHTTNEETRRFLLGNPKAPAVMDCIRRLIDAGITLHTQAVICPGINDGEELIKTTEDLAALYPMVASLAVVPVGLTKHRERLYPLKGFTKAGAEKLLDSLEPLRRKYRRMHGVSFVYPSDELYIKAGRDFPAARYYDGYPQIDNGVGLVRDFMEEFAHEKRGLFKVCHSERSRGIQIPPTPLCQRGASGDLRKVILVTGHSFAPYLKLVSEEVSTITGIDIKVMPVKNELFGHSVTVTGLLCGADIADALKGKKADAALIPSVTMRDGENVFLDDLTPQDIEKRASIKVVMVEPTASGLIDGLKAFLKPQRF